MYASFNFPPLVSATKRSRIARDAARLSTLDEKKKEKKEKRSLHAMSDSSETFSPLRHREISRNLNCAIASRDAPRDAPSAVCGF